MPVRSSAARRPKQELTPELIDESSPTPLYHQIYVVLRERIRTGLYPGGSLLPGEQELVKLLGVSRITVKRALSELAASGFVTRHRGRGTTVTFDAAAPVVKGSVENLLDSLRLMGLGTEVELLEVSQMRAPTEVADLLGGDASAKVQRAVRLRKIEGKPFSYLVTYVPADIAARFNARDLANKPLLELLARAGHEAVEAEQWITATSAELKVARALGIASGAPLLEIKRIMRDREGRGVEVLHGFYRPDRFQHHMKLARRRRGGQTEWQ